jgi:hypothetical protein
MPPKRGNLSSEKIEDNEPEVCGEIPLKLFESMMDKLTDRMIKQMDLLFKKHSELLTSEIFQLHKKLELCTAENTKLKTDMSELSKKCDALALSQTKLADKLENMKQNEMINDISINGEFNLEHSKEKVVEFVNQLYPSSSVTAANVAKFALFKKGTLSHLKIRLDSNSVKARIFQERKNCSYKNIYLSEALTTRKYSLLVEAKKLAKLGQIKAAWSKNGILFAVKIENSKPVKIEHTSDLQKFIT